MLKDNSELSLHISLHIWCLVCIVGHSKSSGAARIWQVRQTMQSLSTPIIADRNW